MCDSKSHSQRNAKEDKLLFVQILMKLVKSFEINVLHAKFKFHLK